MWQLQAVHTGSLHDRHCTYICRCAQLCEASKEWRSPAASRARNALRLGFVAVMAPGSAGKASHGACPADWLAAPLLLVLAISRASRKSVPASSCRDVHREVFLSEQLPAAVTELQRRGWC